MNAVTHQYRTMVISTTKQKKKNKYYVYIENNFHKQFSNFIQVHQYLYNNYLILKCNIPVISVILKNSRKKLKVENKNK